MPPVESALIAAGLATHQAMAERRDWFRALIDLLRVRARTIVDIVRQAEPYLRDAITYDPDAVGKQWKDRPATAQLLQPGRATPSPARPTGQRLRSSLHCDRWPRGAALPRARSFSHSVSRSPD